MKSSVVIVFCTLFISRGLCGVADFFRLLPLAALPNLSTRYCPFNAHPSYFPVIREAKLLEAANDSMGSAEVSEAIATLITKVTDSMSKLIEDTNSTEVLMIAGKAGTMLMEISPALSKVLTSTDQLLLGGDDRFDAQLVISKLKFIETTKETLDEFFIELLNFTKLKLSGHDKISEDFLQAQVLLIDRTTESYQIIYESTTSTMQDILASNIVNRPVKKMIAARVLTSASNNIKSFATLRKRIHAMLLNIMEKDTWQDGNIDVESLQDQFQEEFLSTVFNNTVENDDKQHEEEDETVLLTSEEEKQLEELLNNHDSELH